MDTGSTEPSMDDILASIQRIITDDPSGLSAARRPRGAEPTPAAPPQSADDVLELTSPVAEPTPPAPPPAPVSLEAEADPIEAEPEPEPAPIPVAPPIVAPVAVELAPPPAEPAPIRQTPAPQSPLSQSKVDMTRDAAVSESLVSDTAARASRDALASLSSVLIAPPATGTTLDDLVRDMLRPLLKEWLDEKLPGMVNDLVAKEIARITGRED